METKVKFTSLHRQDRAGHPNRGADRQALWGHDGYRFRVQIHVDESYSFQSHAKIEMWTADKWSEVWRMFGDEMFAVVSKEFAKSRAMTLDEIETFLLDRIEQVVFS